jgi:hypothetical protein
MSHGSINPLADNRVSLSLAYCCTKELFVIDEAIGIEVRTTQEILQLREGQPQ